MNSTSDLKSTNTTRTKSSVSETGHYKNVVNFKTLKTFAQGLGAAYTPQKTSLQLAQVSTLLDQATTLHENVKNQNNTVALTVDQRQAVFENIKPFTTRIINTLSATNVIQKTIIDAKSINAKIQGARINKKEKKTTAEDLDENNENKEEKTNSVSRQSYDSLYENFKSLNNLLLQDGNYQPLETDINLVGLTIKQNEMLAANENIGLENNKLENDRIARNKILYLGENALVEVARGIKKYIRGKFGISSPEFNQIKNLKFTALK